MKISKEMEKEFFFYLKREAKKLEIVFKKIKIKKGGEKVFELANSYFKDLEYFLEKKEFVKAFELENYLWGILDTLANLNLLEVPEEIKKWFKA